MDVGLGSLIDKFEEHFGKTVTKVLLALAGITFSLGCAKVIWEVALGPAVHFVAALAPKANLLELLSQAGFYAFASTLGVGVATVLWASTALRKTRRMLSEADEDFERASKRIAEANELNEHTKKMLEFMAGATEALPPPLGPGDYDSPTSPRVP